MRKHLAVFLMLFGLVSVSRGYAQSAPTDSLSLKQVIQNVLTNQPSLTQIQDQVAAAEARIRQAKVAYSPKVAANVDYSHIDPVPSFVFANGNAVNISPYNNYNFNVGIDQTIYDFGRTKTNIALARSQMLTTKDRERVVKWTLSYYTIQIFYGVLFLKHSIKVEDEQIATLKSDLQLVKKRQENGVATNYDLLTTKVQIATEKNRKIDLMNQLNKQLITLRKLMGWKQSKPLAVKGNLAEGDAMGISGLPALNVNKRPDYQILKDQKNIYKKEFELDQKLELPSLDAQAGAGFKDGYPKNLNKLYGNWILGVNLRIPIFTGHISRYKQQEAEANIQSVNAQEQNLVRNMQSNIAKARSDFDAAKKKLATAKLQIKQAEEQIKLARVRYESGVITSQDLLDSETKLAQAKLQRLETIYQMTLSRYDLQKELGISVW